MKILFSVGNTGFLRNFEHALRLLAERGHHVYVMPDRMDRVGGSSILERLQRDFPEQVHTTKPPDLSNARWLPLATKLRLSLDSWRYLDRRYKHSPSLRARGQAQAPPLAKLGGIGSGIALPLLRPLLRTVERALPASDHVEKRLKEVSPDLLLVTPLLYFGSQQVEYVRAARRLGIPTALGVGSWDHLTTKGLIHEVPDRLIVWNEAQRIEAAELQGVPPERVTVTGAQAYDHWFVQRCSTSKEEFCAKVGLPADRPLLLYLCSSPFIAPHEVPFVRRWIEAIRHAPDPGLRRAAILIRPHPQNAEQWRSFDCAQYEAVGIWPRAGANPVDDEARAEYFDSMFHSVAVVGVNTSALIESGIVGRPVYTVTTGDFAGQQEGTLHFQHLKNVNGGLLHVAATLDEHIAQLVGAVREVPLTDERSRAFIQAFVRPFGLDVSAASRFVDAIEAQGREQAPMRRQPAREDDKAKKAKRKAEPGARPLRVMFAILSPEFLRYFDSTMRELGDRGVEVSVAVNWQRERKQARLEGIDDERVKVLGIIPKRTDLWTPMARAVRGTYDFVRYFHPRLSAAPILRARMKRKVLPRWLARLDRIQTLDAQALDRVYRLLNRLESAIPVSRRLRHFLDAHRPDLVVVSPLVDAASDQVDLVRTAQAMGIPAVAAIASWDNLTNKGHLRVQPDLVTVWNEQQKQEATTFHGVEPGRVAVTGAQLFDRWFERRPSQSREDFCRMVGLPADRPIILYTGSSVFIARSEIEAPFARRWMTALRESGDPALRDAAILIRPHPFNCEAWEVADFSDLDPVSIFPRHRYTPAAEDARTSLFDSLYYCAAVVGVNTSAMIEATILGRPVLATLTPEFAATQEGTVHFHYLLPENGGFLRVAQSLEQHVQQLSHVLQHPEVTREQTQRFVAGFLRPHGVERPATPVLADALQRAALAGRSEARDTAGIRLTRVAAWPLAVLLKWVSLGENAGTAVKRAAFEVWRTLGRATKPVRRFVRSSRANTRPSGMTNPFARLPRRALRLARHARYHVAVWIRGEAQQR